MKKLTEKQLNFCDEYVANGRNGLQAYKVAYQQENVQICKAEAYNLLKDVRVRERIREIEFDYRFTGYNLGIDKKAIMAVILEALVSEKDVTDKTGVVLKTIPDHQTRLNAIDRYAKLVGDFAPSEQSVKITDETTDVDVSNLKPEELKKLKEAILKTL